VEVAEVVGVWVEAAAAVASGKVKDGQFFFCAIQVFLEMQGIDLLGGDVWGHRKDLDEYFTVDESHWLRSMP
jgi:hypothetical protein